MSKNKANFLQSEAQKIREGVLKCLQEEDKNYCPSEEMILTLKDNNGNLYGGVVGFYFLGCLNIEWVWVDKAYRKKGYGKRLLKMIDDFALQHKIKFIILFVYGEEAIGFYKQHGYSIEFFRTSYDHQITKYYLRKNL